MITRIFLFDYELFIGGRVGVNLKKESISLFTTPIFIRLYWSAIADILMEEKFGSVDRCFRWERT